MNLIQAQRTIQGILGKNEIQILKITISSKKFLELFHGSGSNFLRKLKNGLYSLGGKTNREFFRNFSGFYLIYYSKDVTELFLVYDDSSSFSQIQLYARIKKLTGIDSNIEVVIHEEFLILLNTNPNMTQKMQCFGEFYSKKNS
jgi:hypothetical protein